MYPPLHPTEVSKLTAVAGLVCRYDRAPALDRRGDWPFLAIAGPHEALAAEVLLALFSSQRVFCGYESINEEANDAIFFLSSLQERLSIS